MGTHSSAVRQIGEDFSRLRAVTSGHLRARVRYFPNMKRKDFISRLQDYLEQGKESVHSVTETLTDKYEDDVLPLARRTFKRSKRRVLSAEELLADTLSEHRTTALILGVGIVTLILVTLFASNRIQQDTQDW